MNVRFLSDFDIHLLTEGSNYRSYEKMGSHLTELEKQKGTHFAVWAPNASGVRVMGEWNDWSPEGNRMQLRDSSGIWECFVPGVGSGALYKYFIHSKLNNYSVEKADPYAFSAEVAPQTASRVWDLSYSWSDADWMAERSKRNALSSPLSIYEIHLGSWKRAPEEENRFLTYREAAELLVKYVLEMGYTHVQFLPLSEHAFYGSWGYQTIAYYAPTGRYGTPQDLMFLIDSLHQAGIGVLLDWVPAHFPQDGHGLVYFDGTHLYEHQDPRKGMHRDWGTYIFNYGRPEVCNFLIGNALFWLDKYHIDGLRVDAVASMLYLDYSRKPGEWIPNPLGGKENLEAIEFLRSLNDVVTKEFPDVLMIAEESTDWPMVSWPTNRGGLGFSMKWNMGWMHDMLDYMQTDPIYRSYHHNLLTFGIMYAYSERFILAFSHDEVVHLKKSLVDKMPGDEWQKFANLRLLYGFMFGHPGKKLLFMGSDFAQWKEWNHDANLDWDLLDLPLHQGMKRWIQDLHKLYRSSPSFYELDFDPKGFEWIDCHDHERSIVSFLRWGLDRQVAVVFVCNFTPVPRHNYRIGVPWGGYWEEILNSDATIYGGSGQGNMGGIDASPLSFHGRADSLNLTLPPLGVIILTSKNPEPPDLTTFEDEETLEAKG